MQELQNDPALRILLKGSSKHFIILITDAGYQFIGKIKLPKQIFTDLRKLAKQAGALFLGEFKHNYDIFGLLF